MARSKSPEPTDSYEDRMINTAHKVVLICDGILDGQPCYAIAVTESARAHSDYSVSTGMQTAHPRLCHF